jgi:hypothetical protein
LDAKESPIAGPALSAVGFSAGGTKVSEPPPTAGYGTTQASTEAGNLAHPGRKSQRDQGD